MTARVQRRKARQVTRRRCAMILTVSVVVGTLALGGMAAFADGGTGYLQGGTLGAVVGVSGGTSGGGGGGSPSGGGSASGGGSSGGGSTAPPCGHQGQAPCPAGPATPSCVTYNPSGVGLAGGPGLSPAPCPTGGAPAPPPPPPPPTAAEAANLVHLPAPVAGTSPSGDGIPGLTGMPTWVWDANGAGGLSVTASIRGYSVTSSASPTRWVWTMWQPGDTPSQHNPPPTITANRPGSASSPAASYTYETLGHYTITLTVTWGGSFTYSGPGGSGGGALGVSSRSSSRPFAVAELRPVLSNGDV